MHNTFAYCGLDPDGDVSPCSPRPQFSVERGVAGEAFSWHLIEVNDKTQWV